MKSFTDLFIKRPVLAIVISFVILIAELQAMKTLNVRQYPRSDIAAITVTTVYVGDDAELVRGFITTPIERDIAAADGIDYIQSQSTQSLSTITARLKLNYDANKAPSFFFSRRRRHTRLVSDWSSDVCSSDLQRFDLPEHAAVPQLEPLVPRCVSSGPADPGGDRSGRRSGERGGLAAAIWIVLAPRRP